MTWLLVPRDVGARALTVWIGGLRESEDTALTVQVGTERLPVPRRWDRWSRPDGSVDLIHQRVVLEGLRPATEYTVVLHRGERELRRARARTLPEALPRLDQRPFTVLLGSCFSVAKDREGRVGRAYASLPSGRRPDLKFLCGDQVYLDAPWYHFLFHRHSADDLARLLLSAYEHTWNQTGLGMGMHALLRDAGAYFCTDDHDFWNNAPLRGTIVRDTWDADGRAVWLNLARTLCTAFQSPNAAGSSVRVEATISVPPLSLFVTDTRFDRDPDRVRFMADEDMENVCAWIEGLQGPGVLVIGQLVFANPADWRGEFFDWGLPDYAQYATLVKALLRAKHSIVLLTGDVHFGRIASCALPSGAELVEVVASPLALVGALPRVTWTCAPAWFPAREIPGVVARRTVTVPYGPTENHFATVDFAAVGRRVQMSVRSWPISPDTAASSGVLVDRRWLH